MCPESSLLGVYLSPLDQAIRPRGFRRLDVPISQSRHHPTAHDLRGYPLKSTATDICPQGFHFRTVAHRAFDPDDAPGRLRRRFLPYYGEDLRAQRLSEVLGVCRNNIDHVAPYVGRELYLQAHRRLVNSLGEYLQALFISRRVYPVSYDKWIRFQLVDVLGEPDLYRHVVELIQVSRL